MSEDRPFFGILLMIGFCLLVPLSDVLAKLLGAEMSLGELITVRAAIMALMLVATLAVTAGFGALRLPGWILRLLAIRAVLHLIATACFFAALRYLPIADAVAIAFILPFLMLLAGKFFLGEEVGGRRLGACAVGFVGTLLVIQPSFAVVGWPALLPVVVAFLFTAFMLITRVVARRADPLALQAASGIAACGIMVPLFVIGTLANWPEFQMRTPDQVEVWMLIALAGLATVAQLLMTWALRFAPSATLAPIQYLEIPFATLVGWLVFRDLPNGLAAVGIVITVAAGLYVVFRERALSRTAPPPPP